MTRLSRTAEAATDSPAILDQLSRFDGQIAALHSRLVWARSESDRPLSRDLTTGLPNRRSLQSFLLQRQVPGRARHEPVWALLLTVRSVSSETRGHDGPRRHRWFRAAGRELSDLVAEAGLVGRWSTDEIAVLVPSASHTLRREVVRRVRDLERRMPDGLGLRFLCADLDPAILNDPDLDLAAALG